MKDFTINFRTTNHAEWTIEDWLKWCAQNIGTSVIIPPGLIEKIKAFNPEIELPIETPIKVIYKKYNDGDPLTQEEVERGHEHFSRLSKLLLECGETFHLAFYEAVRMEGRFRDILRAREFDKK